MTSAAIRSSSPRPRFSVVIPVWNGAGTIRETLASIFSTGYQDLEVIVVDDASTDGSSGIAAEFSIRLIRHNLRRGAATARNDGAAAARGEIILFVDSDVLIPPVTFRIIERRLSHPAVSGVIGLLGPVTRFRDFWSQYKNFYMHYTYLKLPEQVAVFYTSIAAIRKDIFNSCGGFDATYRGATIEDMEFGIRVTEKGFRIVLDKSLQVEHLKRYGPLDLFRTGFRRAAGVAGLMLRGQFRRRKPNYYHTAPASFVAGIPLAATGILLFLAGLFTGSIYFYLAALICYIVIIAVNAGLLIGLARHTRPLFLLPGGAVIFIDLLGHGLGIIYGITSYLLKGKRS